MKNSESNYGWKPIAIIGVLFFIMGFITWLNATLIPYLKLACELSNFESFFVTFAFYISYFVMALPSSWVLNKSGFKNGMSLGLIVMGLGALMFIPAAYSRTYELFLFGLFLLGTGLAVLQTASNPYVTILGPIESAAKRISIMGTANKIAGIISPIVLGAFVLKGTDSLEQRLSTLSLSEKTAELNLLAERVINPYVFMAVILFILALMIRFSNLPIVNAENEEMSEAQGKKSLVQYTYLWFGVLAIFVYVGVEVIAVDTLISYGKWWGFEMSQAKFFSSITMAAMIVGYFTGIVAIPKYIKQEKALALFSILGILFSILAIFTTGFTSVLFIALLGFANSIMWPAIWPLAIDGLGKYTKIGSALLVMAIAGGALIPLLYGYLVDIVDARIAYSILIPGYFYLLFFAIKGHKIGKIKISQ
ncbi:MAG TPA: glucose/galactose MFS transporter [Bacteroidales bacterium]|nr:MAG: glucose/galactose MFS transporter [Bacteroidetes bacterium GWF2_33_38]OFY88624.1 MAG: glucose/galactose MFS transporter [Bacteroidetes bacterium RIFOXYA2_FULL_33_7]HBF88999.1 glucose/galactose MFS transporter [Bacteroidales bacterium]